jgi:hypothetical protein
MQKDVKGLLRKFLDFLFYNFPTNSKPIAHNVPAAYDVLPARIRALRSKDQGWQNVARVAYWRRSVNRPVI